MNPDDSTRKSLESGTKNVFSDKIVLVGGTYDQRDRHLTAFGEVDGYHLIARAVEAELRGKLARRESSQVFRFGMEFVLAGVIAWFHHFFRHFVAGIMTAVTVTLIPITLSFLLFVSVDFWFDSLPFLLSFWMMKAYFSDLPMGIARKIFPDQPMPAPEQEEVLVVEE